MEQKNAISDFLRFPIAQITINEQNIRSKRKEKNCWLYYIGIKTSSALTFTSFAQNKGSLLHRLSYCISVIIYSFRYSYFFPVFHHKISSISKKIVSDPHRKTLKEIQIVLRKGLNIFGTLLAFTDLGSQHCSKKAKHNSPTL
jgi:hypothetical protein